MQLGSNRNSSFFNLIGYWMQFHNFNEKSNKNIKNREDDVMQWQKQADNITTNMKVKIDLTLPEFSATKIVMWDFYVDE